MPKKKVNRLHHKYRNLELDDFQQEALWHLEKETSLLISAPTGTGKTLIADFLIDRSLKLGKKVIYTAPIKALVNQKYQDFSGKFSRKNVGMTTGDVTILPGAPVMVVTTEIFRNMLLRNDPRLIDLDWVIFDEIHYLNHEERGTVWEESILLKPKEIRMLGLSATVPNIAEIAGWIRSIHQEPLAVVSHSERAVPLEHFYFNQACQAIPHQELAQNLAETALSDHDAYDFKGGNLSVDDIHLPDRISYRDPTHFVDLVQHLRRHRMFPALFFSFSRRSCEQKAKEIANRQDYLGFQQKQAVEYEVQRVLSKVGIKKEEIPHYATFFHQWMRGIGIHHAGLLPVVKKITENLLNDGLIRLLFATETFAVGVNMPVRTVCFDSLKKFDGQKFRFLTQQEYFQMAGRAGRRGKDRKGNVLSLVDFGQLAKDPLPEWNEEQLEPITSKFEITYNMVLNLVNRFDQQQIPELLSKTFSAYQDPDYLEKLMADYRHKRQILHQLGYLQNDNLTEKGEIGSHIYVQELLLSELVDGGELRKLKPHQLAGIAACLSWESRVRLAPQPRESYLTIVDLTRDRIARTTGLSPQQIGTMIPEAALPITKWVQNHKLEDILKQFPMDPGDFVQLCRATIDILRQLYSVTANPVASKIQQAVAKIDRSVVQIRL